MTLGGVTGAGPISESRVLLVEGKDEFMFFSSLLGATPGLSPFQVIPVGKEKLRDSLSIIREMFDRAALTCEALGVVRDADEDASGAFQSVRDALCDGEWASPGRPGRHGEVTSDFPKIGVFIMPDGRQRGALETLCRRAVEDTEAGRCATEYLRCMERAGRIAGVAARRDKAFAHTYLAGSDDPVARVGEGAQQGIWDYTHAVFSPLVDFVRRLGSA